MQHHFLKTNNKWDDMLANPFSSTVKLVNEMNLKSRLPHFSFTFGVSDNVRFVVSFVISHLWVTAAMHWLQCRPTGPFKSLFRDQVLCRWPRKYHQSVCANCPEVCTICFGLMRRPILLPDTVLVQSGFQIIIIILWKTAHAKFYSQVRPYQLYPTQVKFEGKMYCLILYSQKIVA